MDSASAAAGAAQVSAPATVANANSRSVSMASMSSEGSSNCSGNVSAATSTAASVQAAEMTSLTTEVRLFKEALARLRLVFAPDSEPSEIDRVACHEHLGEVLSILKAILKKYPMLRSAEVLDAAGFLINQVESFGHPGGAGEPDLDYDELFVEQNFHSALDTLAMAFTNRVSEYISTDVDSASPASSGSKSGVPIPIETMAIAGAPQLPTSLSPALPVSPMTPEQLDALLLRNYQGVDHALKVAKKWSKYVKDVMTYVEKRIQLDLEWAKSVTKLAQSMRPILREESYLPFQMVYCAALDHDLELCANTQATCSLLQGYKFMEPFKARREEHNKTRKAIKERWTKELKRMQETVANLRKAKTSYVERNKEYERCKEAVRIAEQGAEIGATGENKVDKRKRLEEDALSKASESETAYRAAVIEANDRHRQLLAVKGEVLQQLRDVILQGDQTSKAVTVNYFQLQHSLATPMAGQLQELCETSRLYEPGSQFMEYVRVRLGPVPPTLSAGDHRFAAGDPFSFEPYSSDGDVTHFAFSERQLQSQQRKSLDMTNEDYSGMYRYRGEKSASSSAVPLMAWAREASESDSESRESGGRSRETSPSASPRGSSRRLPADEVDADHHTEGAVSNSASGGGGSIPPGSTSNTSTSRRTNYNDSSMAARTHNFRKLKTPTRCRECDSYVYFQGVDCADCGLSAHKKCLEALALVCGKKRLPRKMTTFGVDLHQHLLDSNAQIPPLVCKCVHEIDKRGLGVKGIYRTSGVKSRIERICQAFESAPELVELGDITPNVIADVLKFYLRQLPEPLLTFTLYNDFVRVAKTYPAAAQANNDAAGSSDPPEERDDSAAVAEMADLCRRLPRHHLRTLAFLMHHLNRVAAASETNNMPASNLAIMFGPGLLRTSEGSASLSTLADTDHQTRAIELLIVHAAEIFGSAESVLPKDYYRFTVTKSPRPAGKSRSRGGGYDMGSGKGATTERHRSVDIASMTGGSGHDAEFQSLPGHVSERESNEDYLTDEDDDVAEAIPSCWLPDDSARSKKSPLMLRSSSPPKINKVSLKSFSGLEGLTPERLSTQDSLESSAGQRLSKQSSSSVPSSGDPHHPVMYSAGAVGGRRSVPHDATTTGRSQHHPNQESKAGTTAHAHRPSSESLFAKMGKAAKKHSLDEDYLSPPLSHPPLSDRLSGESARISTQDASGNSNHSDMTDSSGGPGGGRSSSLSEDSGKRPAASSSSAAAAPESASAALAGTHSKGRSSLGAMSTSLPSSAPVANQEEFRVKIQVPGGIQSSLTAKHVPVTKQSSIDKGDA